MKMMKDYLKLQKERRAHLFGAHQQLMNDYWDVDGKFIWKHNPGAHGGYRAMLWHCLSYLAGDVACVERANRIIVANYTEQRCHFTPGAAVDVLFEYRDKLTKDAIAKLERYLTLNLSFMSTEDLIVHGYNDNHPYKAMHALIVGGEMMNAPEFVAIGLDKLRGAVKCFRRAGFPSEYNSPNYTPVSLNPLANMVSMAKNEEARDLALQLEHFYWQDLALHFDPTTTLPAGPYSRGYVNDYSGLLSGTLCLLMYLFPERFDVDLIKDVYESGMGCELIDPGVRDSLPFYLVHPVWYASATYHLDERIEESIFADKSGGTVRGIAESGTWIFRQNDPEKKPAGAPDIHHSGPRRALLTTYYGRGYTLGTAQYGWLGHGQAHGLIATVKKGGKRTPRDAAIYYARMFFDDHSPYIEAPDFTPGADKKRETYDFSDEGEVRTMQHNNTAVVFYNPNPLMGKFNRLRTGIFRPIMFSQPHEIYVGGTKVSIANYISDTMQPIAIDEGGVYIGIIPLRPVDRGQQRRADLHIHTYTNHLAITLSSAEGYRAYTYEELLETGSGFVFEIHEAKEFRSFAEFRSWLAAGTITDRYYTHMRKVEYARKGLALAACYSPYQYPFLYTTVNESALPLPVFRLDGVKDPGYGLALSVE